MRRIQPVPNLPKMARSKNCVAVIPCHNEAETVGSLVAQIRETVDDVIVVDDGSADLTAAKASAAGARVIGHAGRSGKGTSLLAGWTAARSAGFEWAITLDGDGQHSPRNIPAFLHAAETTGTPLIIGNRMDRPDSMPRLRRWINRWLSRKISELTDRELPDTQCGFRLVHLPTLSEVPLKARHFEIESEMIFQFALHGHAIGFVPIDVIYAAEHSKIRPLIDTVRWWKWYLRARRGAAHARASGQAFLAKSSTRVPCSIQTR